MEQLTSEEFQILLNALDVWEIKDANDALFRDMIGTMAAGLGAKTKEERVEARKKMDQEAQARRQEAELKVRSRKERGIMLKAKLLQLRDAQGIEEISNGNI